MGCTQGYEGGKTKNPQSQVFSHKSHLYMYIELGFNGFYKVIIKKTQKKSSNLDVLVKKDDFPIKSANMALLKNLLFNQQNVCPG